MRRTGTCHGSPPGVASAIARPFRPARAAWKNSSPRSRRLRRCVRALVGQEGVPPRVGCSRPAPPAHRRSSPPGRTGGTNHGRTSRSSVSSRRNRCRTRRSSLAAAGLAQVSTHFMFTGRPQPGQVAEELAQRVAVVRIGEVRGVVIGDVPGVADAPVQGRVNCLGGVRTRTSRHHRCAAACCSPSSGRSGS